MALLLLCRTDSEQKNERTEPAEKTTGILNSGVIENHCRAIVRAA